MKVNGGVEFKANGGVEFKVNDQVNFKVTGRRKAETSAGITTSRDDKSTPTTP